MVAGMLEHGGEGGSALFLLTHIIFTLFSFRLDVLLPSGIHQLQNGIHTEILIL